MKASLLSGTGLDNPSPSPNFTITDIDVIFTPQTVTANDGTSNTQIAITNTELRVEPIITAHMVLLMALPAIAIAGLGLALFGLSVVLPTIISTVVVTVGLLIYDHIKSEPDDTQWIEPALPDLAVLSDTSEKG